MPPPNWLPALISMDGNEDEIYQRLYEVFKNGFIDNSLTYNGLPVWWDRKINNGEQFPSGFLHIVTHNDSAGNRVLDRARASCLSWCAPIIRNANDGAIRNWEYKEANGKINTYLWLEGSDYVVILQKRTLKAVGGLPEREIYFLVTAWHVDGDSSRRSLQRKYRMV